MRIDLFNVLGKWNKTDELKNKTRIPTNYKSIPEKGQVLKGQITDIQQSKVTIRLEDGKIVEAKMTDSFEFVIGDKLSFLVKESSVEQLLLKPLIEGEVADARITQVLKNAGLPIDTKNVEMVTKLIEKNMPINKETLVELSMYTKRFPEAKIDHLIFLMKNDIMITKESLHYVNELLKNQHSMTQNISSFNDDVSKIINKTSGALVVEAILKENDNATNVFTKIRNFFLKPEEQVIVPKEKLEFPLTHLMSSDEAKALLDDTSQISHKAVLSEASKNSLEQFVEQKGKAFSDLFTVVEELDIPLDIKEATNKLLAQRVTYSMLNNELMLKQDDLQDVERLNSHYNKVYGRIMDVLNLNLQDTSESVQRVLKEAVNIKNSVEIMNQLNQNYQFFHIPIMLNNQKVNSELYIMNNKKLNKNSDERISALLRLDFRNLGHMDIYVAKTGNNLEISFYVDNKDTERHLSDHSKVLYNRLLEEAFNVLGIGVQMKEKEFDIVNDFFEADDSDSGSKRFTFDMRA